jgi:hypothetical protein
MGDPKHRFVAWIERSEIRDEPTADFASLTPGYTRSFLAAPKRP